MWDIFISHASEDKEEVVRPLARELKQLKLSVWVDEFTLTLGDSLRRKVDHGLSKSRYGVVILSHDFFSKEWPQKELDALVAREADGEKVILPVWHRLKRSDVAKYSPLLADRLAIETLRGIPAVAQEIAKACDLKYLPPPTEVPTIIEDMRHHGIWHHHDEQDAKGTAWAAIASEAGKINYNYEFITHFLRLKNQHNGWYVKEYIKNYTPSPIPTYKEFIEILKVRKQHLERVIESGDLNTNWSWPSSWGKVPWWGPVVHVYPDLQGNQPPDEYYLREVKVEISRIEEAIEQYSVLQSVTDMEDNT